MSAIVEYFQALERLKSNKPINVSKGTKINNDNVALEAGRKKGSIKKSRSQFSALIEEINKAQEKTEPQVDILNAKLSNIKNELVYYKQQYENAIGREVMFLEKINKLEKELTALTSKNVVVI